MKHDNQVQKHEDTFYHIKKKTLQRFAWGSTGIAFSALLVYGNYVASGITLKDHTLFLATFATGFGLLSWLVLAIMCACWCGGIFDSEEVKK